MSEFWMSEVLLCKIITTSLSYGQYFLYKLIKCLVYILIPFINKL